jgi:hypothetical protein
MCWLIGILVGIAYGIVMFFLASKLDKDAYYKGINLTLEQCWLICLVLFMWPLTIFIPKLRNPEFYANLNFKRKK